MSLVAARLRVAGAERTTPSFMRLRLEGADLALLHDGGPAGLRDTRVKLEIGASEPLGSGVLPAHWYRAWREMPAATRGVLRTYTVAAVHHDDAGALAAVDVDVLLTDHAGPGVDWARSEPVGDELVLVGPGAPEPGATGEDADPVGLEYRPGSARDVVLIADATALPAARAIAASEAGGPRRVRAVVTVPSEADRTELGVRTDWVPGTALVDRAVDVCATTWLRWSRARELRCGPVRPARQVLPEVDIDAETLWETPWLLAHGAAGTDASATAALTGVANGTSHGPTPEGLGTLSIERPPYFWVAGEAGDVVAVRRALVRDLGVPRERVAFMGYWRRGRAEVV